MISYKKSLESETCKFSELRA